MLGSVLSVVVVLEVTAVSFAKATVDSTPVALLVKLVFVVDSLKVYNSNIVVLMEIVDTTLVVVSKVVVFCVSVESMA